MLELSDLKPQTHLLSLYYWVQSIESLQQQYTVWTNKKNPAKHVFVERQKIVLLFQQNKKTE